MAKKTKAPKAAKSSDPFALGQIWEFAQLGFQATIVDEGKTSESKICDLKYPSSPSKNKTTEFSHSHIKRHAKLKA